MYGDEGGVHGHGHSREVEVVEQNGKGVVDALQRWISCSVADPGSGAFFTPGSGINYPDHISES